jgi:hypothetical protein
MDWINFLSCKHKWKTYSEIKVICGNENWTNIVTVCEKCGGYKTWNLKPKG